MTRKMVLLAALMMIVGLPMAYAQAGAGKPFGARDPKTCTDRKAPAKGGPSAAQAAMYVACDRERIDDYNRLGQVGDLKVDVAKPHTFNIYMDSAPNIDTAQPVYGIRGSFKTGYCTAMKDGGVAGKNCQTADVPVANGSCYKDNFGDWHCTLGGAQLNAKNDQPPLK
jgi:hypothetical protein